MWRIDLFRLQKTWLVTLALYKNAFYSVELENHTTLRRLFSWSTTLRSEKTLMKSDTRDFPNIFPLWSFLKNIVKSFRAKCLFARLIFTTCLKKIIWHLTNRIWFSEDQRTENQHLLTEWRIMYQIISQFNRNVYR